ncbi:hypothetical protein HL653_21575 [Sphingomonas sp. AP4-R1]|uniref:hypothetical protein n=1 Tax=Sphingomonas sp. AP4-R1 TaxID=2735134 RepID=UPI00149385CA|nr:hypothetical protein [Sphingomonas sp. AP4-R1]QJU59987.1 hypothetical protein HL653_21575 [Sphingomonas sp. AP4-R1]
MSGSLLINPELWTSSRAGARAGRGFRFQDAAGAWLATRIWSGDVPFTALVAEGVDDLTLHGPDGELRVQVKARHDPRGRFSTAEVAGHLLKSLGTMDATAVRAGTCRLMLLLERPPEDLVESRSGPVIDQPGNAALLAPYLAGICATFRMNLEELLDRVSLVYMADPVDAVVEMVCNRRSTADAIAKLIAHCLRHLVGAQSDRNYRASPDQTATIDATDVERIVEDVLQLVDPNALYPAVAEGLCEPVSFDPVHEGRFYEGVDALPGHVAAGLVLDRPALIEEIAAGLQRQRAALVAGPSGSGKSAAAWLFAWQNRHAVRWYRLRRASADQAHLLVQLARSLEASADRPVGFVLDDVGRDLGGIWEALSTELGHVPGIVLLGTVREEDLFVIGNLASTAIARPELDAELAERIWAALIADFEPAFLHWLEPFELSRGLLLEYSHLLTSGQRMQDTLDAQVRRRLSEGRDDELAILQAVIPITRFSGTIDAEHLRTHLQLAAGPFARALARLVDEHAIRLTPDHALAGLHQIRSAGLHVALSQLLPRSAEDELTETILLLRAQDFAFVLPQLLNALEGMDNALIDALAARFPSLSVRQQAAIFHGLGLAACDRVAAAWTQIVEEEGLEARQAPFAFACGLAGSRFEIPALAKLDATSARFGQAARNDLRTALLARLSPLPDELDVDLDDFHELAAALVPLPFLTPAPAFRCQPGWADITAPLEQALGLAATIREFGIEAAEALVARFGGTAYLLTRLYQETAWVTAPTFDADGTELVVSSNVRFIGGPVHEQANDIVVGYCARLLAAAPGAEIAVSTMIGWDGSPAGFNGYPIADKRIPRENSPSPTRLAWNRAALRAIQARNGPTTESGRANALSSAIIELSEMLADAAEHYCRGRPADVRLNSLLAIRGLLNSHIEPPSPGVGTGSARDAGEYRVADQAYDFVAAVTKLAGDLAIGVERPLISSTEAAELAETASALLEADTWRWLESPPSEALRSLLLILRDLDAILGDAFAFPDAFRRSQILADRTSRTRHARIRFGKDSRARAQRAGENMADRIRAALAARQIEAIVIAKPLDNQTEPYWPRIEYAVLLPVDHLIAFMHLAEEFIDVVRSFSDAPRITIVPMREGMIVTLLAGVIRDSFLPAPDFKGRWDGHLPHPFLEEEAAGAFCEAFTVLVEASTVLANADRPLNEEEMAHAQGLIDRIRERLAVLSRLRDEQSDEDAALACAFTAEVLNRLVTEFDGDPEGSLSAEIARMGNGQPSGFTTQVIAYRIGLLERDILCSRAKAGTGP